MTEFATESVCDQSVDSLCEVVVCSFNEFRLRTQHSTEQNTGR